MELLYADDLVLVAETEELLLKNVKKMVEGDRNEGSRAVVLNLWPAGQKWSRQASNSGPRPPKEFQKYMCKNCKTSHFDRVGR